MITRYNETPEYRTPVGLNNAPFIERCPLLGGNLAKVVIFETKRFVHVLHLG